MNENEPAEQFNRELDEVLSGRGKRAPFSPDPGAMETAARLARADFSGDSAIREALRARLVEADRDAGVFWEMTRRFRRSVYAQTLVAAGLLLLLLPVMRTGPEKAGPAGAAPSARAGLAASLRISSAAVPSGIEAAPVPTAVQSAQRLQAAAPARRPPAAIEDAGIFRSVPMELVPVRLREFPIEIKKGAYPIGQLKGKKLAAPKGSGVSWETEHAVFTLERREISPDELFQRKAI